VSAIRSAFPILYVDDVGRALAFYRDLLGFREVYRFPPDGEPGYVSVELDAGRLGLSRADWPGPHGKPQRPVTGRPFELCLETDDVDALVDRLRAAGVAVLSEPADQPWGERVAFVEDPDGNPVHLRAPAAPPRRPAP
jgi:lactoylglutathione lyase